MCLAVPGKVVEIMNENGMLMGKVDFAGSISKACLEYVPEIQIGQYTVIHAGFAISAIDEEEAMKSFELWREMEEKLKEDGMDFFGRPLNP